MEILQKQHYTSKQLLALSLISIILGSLFSLFFLDYNIGISLLIYVLVFLIGFSVFLYLSDYKPTSQFYVYGVLMLIFSLMLFIYSSEMLMAINIMMVIGLAVLLGKTAMGISFKDLTFLSYFKAPFVFVGDLISGGINYISDIFYRISNRNTNNKITGQVIKGILIALPFLIIFTALFSAADEVFSDYIHNIFSFNLASETIAKILIGFIIAIGSISYFASLFRERQQGYLKSNIGKLKSIEGYVALGLINALFLVFIVIQITYLFGGDANISQQGFTYAQYARRGFAELIMAGILSLFVIFGFEQYIERKGDKHTDIFMYLNILLTSQVLIMMASAFKRLALYEQAFGFTNSRLLAHAIIIWFGVLFVILLAKIIKHSSTTFFEQGAFISFVVFLFIFNIMNPDAFVARQNIQRFEETGKIDTWYLSQLSFDAVPEIFTLLDNESFALDEEKKVKLQMNLRDDLEMLDDELNTNWLSLNFSRSRARDILRRDAKDFPIDYDTWNSGF